MQEVVNHFVLDYLVYLPSYSSCLPTLILLSSPSSVSSSFSHVVLQQTAKVSSNSSDDDVKLKPANAAHDLCYIMCSIAVLKVVLYVPSSANHTEALMQQLPLPIEEST